jgi:hypothetical protein
MRSFPDTRVALFAAALSLLGVGCASEGTDRALDEPAEDRGEITIPTDAVPNWLDLNLPGATSPGYNLVLYRRRIPLLLDMTGQVVHAWPDVRAAGRARLGPDGSLLVISIEGDIREYDWDGELIWQYRLDDPQDFPHHDVDRLANGNRLVLEVDGEGATVWQWHANDHLGAFFGRAASAANLTHVNSIQELPPNRHWEAGDERFRPGNILLSARNLDTVAVVDRGTGEVVWDFHQGLDYQHEAFMIPVGLEGAGNILVFNNRYHAADGERRSAILEIDPATAELAWQYEADNFFSTTGGVQQPLTNGNLLIASSRGGRVFEVTRSGRVVWQWSPPYQPMRPVRYPYDFAPQLAALPGPVDERIERRDPRRWVDSELYRFALGHEVNRRSVGGKRVSLVPSADACRQLRLPGTPRLRVQFGVAPDAMTSFDGRAELSYRVTVQPTTRTEPSEPVTVIEERVEIDEDTASKEEPVVLGRASATLGAWAHQAVTLCLWVSSTRGDFPRQAPFWVVPEIRSGDRHDRLEGEVDDIEARLRARQLEALGYVD